MFTTHYFIRVSHPLLVLIISVQRARRVLLEVKVNKLILYLDEEEEGWGAPAAFRARAIVFNLF